MKSENIAGIVIILLLVAVTATIWCPITQTTTSKWWQAEIVRRGYGTWETTPDGQVWFKWKEEGK